MMSTILQPMTNVAQSSSRAQRLDLATYGNAAHSVQTSTNREAKASPAAGRSRGFVARALALFFMFCLAGSCASLIVWLASLGAAELSSWSLQDLMRGVHGGI